MEGAKRRKLEGGSGGGGCYSGGGGAAAAAAAAGDDLIKVEKSREEDGRRAARMSIPSSPPPTQSAWHRCTDWVKSHGGQVHPRVTAETTTSESGEGTILIAESGEDGGGGSGGGAALRSQDVLLAIPSTMSNILVAFITVEGTRTTSSYESTIRVGGVLHPH